MKLIRLEKDLSNIDEVVQTAKYELEQGNVILCPSHTNYTVAANAENESAIKKVYAVKGRGFTKPLSIHVCGLEMAKKYIDLNKSAELLAKKYLPGKVTLVCKKKSSTPDILTSGSDKAGFMIADFEFCLKLAKACGFGYTGTSANLTGLPPCYSIEEFVAQKGGQPDPEVTLAVDYGNLPKVESTTVIDTTTTPITIIREGFVGSTDILAYWTANL
jgi:L-threonylcarbamoyladenylate synthase